MSFGVHTIQPIATIGEVALVAAEGEEAQAHSFIDSETPEKRGEINFDQKSYTFFQKPTTTMAARFCFHAQYTGVKSSVKQSDNSPMHLASMPSQRNGSSASHRFSPPMGRSAPQTFSTPEAPIGKHTALHSLPTKPNQRQTTPATSMTKAVMSQQQTTQVRTETIQTGERATQTRGREENESRDCSSTLRSRQWAKEETTQWWQERYHQKERDGQKNGQGQDSEEREPDKKRKKTVGGIAAISTANSRTTQQVYCEGGMDKVVMKPLLQHPKIGVFALYYILTKIGIMSDGTSNFSYKKEIESVDSETTTAHRKRLNELKKAIEKEKSAANWGIATKVFSWIGSLVGIITGIALIATGVGAVAGAMMIAGGVIQITSQILEITGGWKKIAELLPGDDPEKKRAVINWMQIGIAVLCLILSGVGILWGGYSNFGEAMQTAMAVFGGIAAMGHGATTIGEGVTVFTFKNKMSEVKRYDKILSELKHRRRDMMEKVEWGMDRLEQLFEDLAHALEFEIELFQADQMVNR